MTPLIKCTTMEGTEIRLNMDHVVLVRPHRGDRGGTGSCKRRSKNPSVKRPVRSVAPE